MTTHVVDVSWTRKLYAYLQLGKMRVYHHLYEWLLLVLLLRMDPDRPKAWFTASILLLVAIVSGQAAACAADDVTGFRDGSDIENYGPSSASAAGPKLLPKPLVAGILSEREAIAFAVGASLLGAAACIGVFVALHWDAPVGAPIGFLLVLALAIQYSSGLKFSYWPGGAEFHIFVVNACLLILPYWAIAHHLRTVVVLLGALVGTWFLLVVGWGHARDQEGDEAAGRRTFAVVAPELYRVFLVTLYFVSVALAIAPFALGLLRPIAVVCVAPLIALATAQMYYGAVRGNARLAMWLGFRCIDVGGLGFAAAILLS